MKPIRLAILGSTGSIGRQTLDVVRSLAGRFDVIGLAAGNNVTLLEEQVGEFQPRFMHADRDADYLVARGSNPGVPVRWAEMEEMAAHPDVDLVIVATVGAAGLGPTLAAIRAGKAVALANKEVLVMAGHIITAEARRSKHGMHVTSMPSWPASCPCPSRLDPTPGISRGAFLAPAAGCRR